MPQKNRNLDIDMMTVISCIAVITLHHNSLVHSYVDSLGWRQSLVVECVFYFAVPVFFMISGINLMTYRSRYSTWVFLKKRAVRTVLPWIFWSIVLFFVYSQHGVISVEPYTIKQAIYMILNNKVDTVYWFFSSLFACYLSVPVFSLLKERRSILWYVVLLNFVFLSCLPVINKWISFSWSLDIPVVSSTSNLIFFLLGYLLYTKPPTDKQRRFLYVLGILGLFFRFFYTLHFSVLNHVTDTTIKGYHVFHSVFYSVAVFLFLYHIEWEHVVPARMQNLIHELAANSFGVYLVHHAVMYVEKAITGLTNNDLAWRIPCIAVTYCISVSIVFIIRKIPVLKYTVGG